LKKGVVLYTVLGFILISMFLISIFLNYLKFNNKFYKDISQNSIILNSLNTIFSRIPYSKEIYSTYPITKDLIIEIIPAANRVNLNELFNKKSSLEVESFLVNLLSAYNIEDIATFLDELKKEGHIYNFRHFYNLLKRINNNSLTKIPWRKYIYFANGQYPIDCELLDENMSYFLGVNGCDNNSSLNIKKYDNKLDYLIEIRFNNLDLLYNFNKKKVVNIESNILY